MKIADYLGDHTFHTLHRDIPNSEHSEMDVMYMPIYNNERCLDKLREEE